MPIGAYDKDGANRAAGADVSGAASPADQIRTAVDRFYRLVLTDRQLGPRFAGVDVRRLRIALSDVLTNALHTPGRVRPTELIAAHQGLGLTGDDYDLLGHYLLSTLLPLRLGTDLLVRVGTILTDARAEVVCEVRARRAALRRAAPGIVHPPWVRGESDRDDERPPARHAGLELPRLRR
jgi:hemoglobin